MKIDQELTFEKTEYYKIICLLSEIKTESKWLARVRVQRNDTEEYVNAGFTVYEQEKEVVIEAARERTKIKLLPELVKLGPPPQWDTETRKILLECKIIHSDILDFAELHSRKTISEMDESERGMNYIAFWKKLIKQSISLSKKIDGLSDIERAAILTISDEALSDPSTPSSLEEIDSCVFVFDFYSNPTKEEFNLHEAQKEKLAKRYLELGW